MSDILPLPEDDVGPDETTPDACTECHRRDCLQHPQPGGEPPTGGCNRCHQNAVGVWDPCQGEWVTDCCRAGLWTGDDVSPINEER